MAERIAVVLFNLGGPDSLEAVKPFLQNLFSDPAIIAAPWILRRPLAMLIASRRDAMARANYALMGGASPILAETQAQAAALEANLALRWPDRITKVFVGMRYWRPTIEAVSNEVMAFEPDRIILAPLYPQFSTTTTASSFAAWRKAYTGKGETSGVCCWYDNDGLAQAHAESILETWRRAGEPKVRLIFSAHGLPEQIVARGDPYQWQIQRTCDSVVARLPGQWDWKIGYQSRVGPMKWLAPSTLNVIEEAHREGFGVLIDPIAFVSEHIETLVELDHDYANIAKGFGVTTYLRAPVVGVSPRFIDGLASAVAVAMERRAIGPDGQGCGGCWKRCGAQV